MEIPGHLLLYLLAALAMYASLVHAGHLRRWGVACAVPLFGGLWFGTGGVMTSVVGFSAGAQVFLGVRLYLAWRRHRPRR